MNKLFFLFLLTLFLTGCATISTSDIPDYPTHKKIEIPKYDRQDVTFSIDFMQEVTPVNENIIVNKQDIADKIKKSFRHSKLFRRVYYVSPEKASNYHYHFNVVMTGTSYSNQFGLILLSGYTLAIVPVWMNFNIDITMHLIVDDQEVYSVTAPQKVKDIIWLGLIAAWPVLNHATVGNHVENNAVNYFMSEIIKNILYEYEPLQKNSKSLYPSINND